VKENSIYMRNDLDFDLFSTYWLLKSICRSEGVEGDGEKKGKMDFSYTS